MPNLLDTLARPLHDLRISVTDRCNFRCTYCMPKAVFGSSHQFLPRADILSFEEITRLTRIFLSLGVSKIRVTGGEPLLRRDLPQLISQLAHLSDDCDLTLTTNGALLTEQSLALRQAGLKRLTVSVDAPDDPTFRKMNDVDFPLHRVLHGIDSALRSGFTPIKINMVVRRGINDHSIEQMAERFRQPEFILRFIEYMDVGNSNRWQSHEVVPANEIIERLRKVATLTPLPPLYPGEVARRFRHHQGAEIGVISSVSQPFCSLCHRARLSADGQLYTCLFAHQGHDLRSPLRNGLPDDAIADLIRHIWSQRSDRYSELRSSITTESPKPEMSLLGG
ncbi:MAG: GTP 3',8-cyclase MoaA [Verrucomicrobiota bacterium]